MKRWIQYALIAGALALIVAPVAAQDATATEEAGGGGVIIDTTFGSGPTNFNPVTSSDATAFQIMALIYPGLIGVNPETAVIEPNAPGAVAKSWDVSEDGLTYTFHLRDDYQWEDGVPVTAKDFQATWDAITSGQTDSPLIFITDTISDIKAVDDQTLQVTFKTASCEALNDAGLQPIPAHRYTDSSGDLSKVDWSKLKDEFYAGTDAPAIGPYKIGSVVADQQIGLVPVNNGQWPDGNVLNDGYVLRIVGDQTVQVEQLLAGQSDVLSYVPPNRVADVQKAVEAGTLASYDYTPGDAWDYIAFNLTDPKNPQPALDDKGNPIKQTPNPLFGDVRVRQALSQAIDIDAIIQGAVFGNGVPIQASYAPGSWAYDANVPFYKYDQVAAGKLLDEAGFVDDDNDPTTPRVANDKALYAAPGTKMEFTMYTNEGNTRRTAIGTIAQDELSKIGVKVDFKTVDFQVLLDMQDQQTFDTTILGWQNAYPDRADQTQLWSATSDVIGGSNFTSYVNPELDKLMHEALTLPGCDQAERAKLYGQIQTILHNDAPYIFVNSHKGMYAWSTKLDGVSPYPGTLYWNLNEWTKAQ